MTDHKDTQSTEDGGEETAGDGKNFFQKLQNAFQVSKDFTLESLTQLKSGSRGMQGALNAILGNKLDEMQSPLALPMRLYRYSAEGFVELDVDKKALKESIHDTGDRVCIFVHGLGSSERTWMLRRKGERTASYAELLKRDTGHVCYYASYNTGRHISKNGRDLADLLNQFFKSYPHKVREINLIGHSMGGLVSRSAAYYGSDAGHAWVKKLDRTFLLGSPLLGAHQEQIGKLTTDILDGLPIPATKITAKFFDMRSAGIQDLGYGYLRDEDWRELDASKADPEKQELTVTNRRNPVPLLKHTRYYLVIGSMSKDPDGIAAGFLGDGIVPRRSARGKGSGERYEEYEGGVSHEVPGLIHTNIPGDPRVYRRLRDWLREKN